MDVPMEGSRVVGEAAAGDAALVARIRAGEVAAETELVRRYTRAVIAVAQHRLRHEENARDVAQETFIVVLERLRGAGIEDPARLAGFVRQTAVNVAIGELRKQTRQRTDTDSEAIAFCVDEHAGPIALLERGQLAQLVRRLINELPIERDRDLLRRHYMLDEEKAALCVAFGLTEPHFDRVIHRARQRLRELAEVMYAQV